MGSASGNTAATFTNNDPGQTSPGMLIATEVKAGAIGANTLPAPPGHKRSVRD